MKPNREERIQNGLAVLKQHPEIPEVRALHARKKKLMVKHGWQGQQMVSELLRHAPVGGDIGGIRSRSKRAKERSFARYGKMAEQHLSEVKTLQVLAYGIKKLAVRVSQRRRYGDPEHLEKQQQSVTERKRQYSQMARLLVWEGIQAGDQVDVGFPNPVEVARKNPKSFKSKEGSTYTMKEVLDFDADKVPGLRERVQQYRENPQSMPELALWVENARKRYLKNP